MEPESDSSDRLIFLDPHYVNAQLDFNKADFGSQSGIFSCQADPRSIHMNQLDPCMTFGFLIKSQDEFAQFKEQLEVGIREDGDRQIFHL